MAQSMSTSDFSKQSKEFRQKPEIHESWRSDYLNSDMDRFYDMAFEYILSKVGAGPNTSILDAGCGYCHHLTRLARSKADIVGIDFSETALGAGAKTIETAGIADRVKLARADLTKLEFESGKFDTV